MAWSSATCLLLSPDCQSHTSTWHTTVNVLKCKPELVNSSDCNLQEHPVFKAKFKRLTLASQLHPQGTTAWSLPSLHALPSTGISWNLTSCPPDEVQSLGHRSGQRAILCVWRAGTFLLSPKTPEVTASMKSSLASSPIMSYSFPSVYFVWAPATAHSTPLQ